MNIKNNQRGFVSIFVASTLMIVTALIVIGFLNIVSRERRQALDEQLSAQAETAAESGINVARNEIIDDLSAGSSPLSKIDDCTAGVNYVTNSTPANAVLDVDDKVEFTCVLIDPEPEELLFTNDSVQTDKAKVIPIKTASVVDNLVVEWYSSNIINYDSSVACPSEFSTPSNWNYIPLLSLEIVRIPPSPFDREAIIANTFNTILYPCGSGSSMAFTDAVGDANIGKVTAANCSGAPAFRCKMEITGVSSQDFYVRIKSIYGPLNVKITAEDVSNNQLKISGVQVVVDATGKANDVFKRIQARVPIYAQYNQAEASIQAKNGVCKLLTVDVDDINPGACP